MKRYLPILALFAACSEPIKCLKCEHEQTGHINEVCADQLIYPDLQMESLYTQLTASGYKCRYYDK
jgi:hypothetical protein